ncbi:hypothetical protein JMJ77_0002143 [Colletotrichum scovillei]|uniref:Uncharacterized protein n=1 Tax=Colletotrichum scovillei TaxID=1209932 RepID=A0A9P7R7B5_9PEZI|nr:hypothetical protein JMJ77_0002143 [Colletotrichum scovillei]KAG7070558.1 hypothetical protein JMJ76_0001808 [Colletotrichum scovillei]KAG7078809.1 hypothetical protein JMJ78_0002475 [Colletotrichum scovillei]
MPFVTPLSFQVAPLLLSMKRTNTNFSPHRIRKFPRDWLWYLLWFYTRARLFFSSSAITNTLQKSGREVYRGKTPSSSAYPLHGNCEAVCLATNDWLMIWKALPWEW